MTATATTPITPVVDRRLAEAEAYVRTRFYPPLPYEYGAYAVAAVDACNEGESEREILLSPDLPMWPKQARFDESGSVSITAEDLVDALRLWHLVEDEENHVCTEHAEEKSGQLHYDGGFEVWTECDLCGATWDHGFDSVL